MDLAGLEVLNPAETGLKWAIACRASLGWLINIWITGDTIFNIIPQRSIFIRYPRSRPHLFEYMEPAYLPCRHTSPR